MIERYEDIVGTLDRAGLIELLEDNEVVIHFKKMDGTVHEIYCTLDAAMIPASSEWVDTGNTGAIAVFDLDTYEWRSIHFERIISIHITLTFEVNHE